MSQSRLFDLGTFAAQLDFHLVTWLKKECQRAAKVENVVFTLKKVHSDFSWPFPIVLNSVVSDLRRKQSSSSLPHTTDNGSLASSSRINAKISTSSVDEKFRALKLGSSNLQTTTATNSNSNGISDSGYISHNGGNNSNMNSLGGTNAAPNIQTGGQMISEQAIHAMLRPHGLRGKFSLH